MCLFNIQGKVIESSNQNEKVIRKTTNFFTSAIASYINDERKRKKNRMSYIDRKSTEKNAKDILLFFLSRRERVKKN
jgi:hypothetical protein